MKKLLSLVLILCALPALFSCSGEGAPNNSQSTTDAETVQTEQTPVKEPFDPANVKKLMGSGSKSTFPVGEDKYDIDCTAYLVKGKKLADYQEVVNNLQTQTTLVKYADNGENGIDGACYQTTLHDDNYTVNVTFYEGNGQLYVTVEKHRAMSPNQIAPASTVRGTNTVFHMPEQPTVGGHYKFGESEIFQLTNGHFIIVDGAQEFSAELTVNYLKNLTGGETPIVDAWFLTHAHPDHSYCVWGIGREPALVDSIKVQGFYYTWPADDGMRMEKDYAGLTTQVANVNVAFANFRDTEGNGTPRYKLHGGMRFYFEEIEVQVLFTQDQIRPYEYGNGFNDSSTCFKFIVHTENSEDTTFLVMGDASAAICTKLMKMYTAETLHPTFFQTLHHGENDCIVFFKYINPDYLNYTYYTSDRGLNKPGYEALKLICKKVFSSPCVIPIPYVQEQE